MSRIAGRVCARSSAPRFDAVKSTARIPALPSTANIASAANAAIAPPFGTRRAPEPIADALATSAVACAVEIAVYVFDRFSESAALTRPAGLRRALRWLFASLIARTVKRLAAAYAERRRIKLAIDELRRWDDRRLRDIGLHPMDIERMAHAEVRAPHGEASAEHKPRQPAAERSGRVRGPRESGPVPGGLYLASRPLD